MNLKINIHLRLLLLGLVIGIVACEDNLNLYPETTITDANFWNTSDDLEMACNYMYNYLPDFGSNDPSGTSIQTQDKYGNTVFGSSSNTISNGSRTADATSTVWNGYYELIRVANNIIEKSVNVVGASEIINKYKGEAYFFRAFAYFELIKRFGDVPYINKTLTLADTLLYSVRINREIVLDSLYADLDKATSWCPQPDEQSTDEYGRITSTAALALKSRVALFEGTWDKFHGSGNYTKHLQIALDASASIIESGKHKLYTAQGDTSYWAEFQYEDGESQSNFSYATNQENILLHIYGENTDNNIVSCNISNDTQGQNNYRPTRYMVDLYLFSDGLPVGKSSLDSTGQETSAATEFRNRDPRLTMSFWTQGQGIPYVTTTGIVYEYTQGIAYITRKFFFRPDVGTTTNFVNLNIIRYAEVLLNYAEAWYELNGTISDEVLDLTINTIRDRATNYNTLKLPHISNAFVSANSLDMREEIRRERTVELFFEGFSYWDLLRWKTAETMLPVAMLGPKYFEVMNSPNTPLTSDGFVIYETAEKRSFDPGRDYLWPIPTQEIALNPRLIQNPNWY